VIRWRPGLDHVREFGATSANVLAVSVCRSSAAGAIAVAIISNAAFPASVPDLSISRFEDLLRAARQQPQPQRLLFVFMGAELPEDSTPEPRQRLAAGAGGALLPPMCVDKAMAEVRGCRKHLIIQ